MRNIIAICAVIFKDGKMLATQRGPSMSLPFKWELPGGKPLAGESDIDCVKREVLEELNLAITVHSLFAENEHYYPNFKLNLRAYTASIDEGTLLLIEHTKFHWCTIEDLERMDWADADIPIIKMIASNFESLSFPHK